MALREMILAWMSAAEDRVMLIPMEYRSMKAAVALGDCAALEEVLEDKAVLCL